jgi:hypothetical protein
MLINVFARCFAVNVSRLSNRDTTVALYKLAERQLSKWLHSHSKANDNTS